MVYNLPREHPYKASNLYSDQQKNYQYQMPFPNGAVLRVGLVAVLEELLNPRLVEVEGHVDVGRVVAAL